MRRVTPGGLRRIISCGYFHYAIKKTVQLSQPKFNKIEKSIQNEN